MNPVGASLLIPVCHASSRTAQRHNPVAVVRPTYSGMNLEALLENIFAQGYRLLPDTLGLPMLRQGSEDMYNPLGADRSYVTLIRIGWSVLCCEFVRSEAR